LFISAFLFYCSVEHLDLHSFPTRRSSDLALDVLEFEKPSFENLDSENDDLKYLLQSEKVIVTPHIAGWTHQSKEKLAQVIVDKIDRKSTRLNSSHVKISYAVFCLKKKNHK